MSFCEPSKSPLNRLLFAVGLLLLTVNGIQIRALNTGIGQRLGPSLKQCSELSLQQSSTLNISQGNKAFIGRYFKDTFGLPGIDHKHLFGSFEVQKPGDCPPILAFSNPDDQRRLVAIDALLRTRDTEELREMFVRADSTDTELDQLCSDVMLLRDKNPIAMKIYDCQTVAALESDYDYWMKLSKRRPQWKPTKPSVFYRSPFRDLERLAVDRLWTSARKKYSAQQLLAFTISSAIVLVRIEKIDTMDFYSSTWQVGDSISSRIELDRRSYFFRARIEDVLLGQNFAPVDSLVYQDKTFLGQSAECRSWYSHAASVLDSNEKIVWQADSYFEPTLNEGDMVWNDTEHINPDISVKGNLQLEVGKSYVMFLESCIADRNDSCYALQYYMSRFANYGPMLVTADTLRDPNHIWSAHSTLPYAKFRDLAKDIVRALHPKR